MVSLQDFNVGQRVSVCVNERNATARTGKIWRVVWHCKDARYNYYIEVDGRKIGKRYLSNDLVAADKWPR